MYDTFRNCKIYFEKQTKKSPFQKKGALPVANKEKG